LKSDVERCWDKREMMCDLRESGALEQDADLILFIYSDEIYNSEYEDKNIVEINMDKDGKGEIGGWRMELIEK
jgi:Replicative DNA helicase